MGNIEILPEDSIDKKFIPGEYLPKDKDEYYLRNEQSKKPSDYWHHLKAHEIEILIKNGNTCDNWEEILVTDVFDPGRIKNCELFGLIRIGKVDGSILHYHDLQMVTGITNSRIISCDIGDNVAIHDVRYLSHYIIDDFCILCNIDEMHTTNHAKFGNGIIKDGEEEDVRVWLDVMNETGSRGIMPFDGMIPGDAYIWAKYRDVGELQKKLGEITQARFDSRRGYYGTVGGHSVIKNSRIIKDVKFGTNCYVKGANKLKNLTINSNNDEPTQIGEGVELVNGIIGYGCHIFYGCKAVRFIIGNNANLKYGARLLNSFLGDNSTVSCCEMLNNLIFPAHEQHHNNSFLIASLVKGQSNMAAGATIGSNHNSRANDGEIQAGRGFWPGLCSSVKHSCRFASFILLAKADYPAELDIPLPFSLLNNNASEDQLEVIPAFWWLFNMYALTRNSWKFQARDKRNTKIQNIEFEFLAPDSVEEIIHARRLLEIWTAKAYLKSIDESIKDRNEEDLAVLGSKLLNESEDKTSTLEVIGEKMEKSKRKVLIIKVWEAYKAYGQMLHYYAVKNLISYMKTNPKASLSFMCKDLKSHIKRNWVNCGGQLISESDINKLIKDIISGKLITWDDIHQRYDELWNVYPFEKQKHAFSILCHLLNTDSITIQQWNQALKDAIVIQEYIKDKVFQSRKKDFDNPFRQATYRNPAEMEAVIGRPEDNNFVKQVEQETEDFKKTVEEIIKRG